MVALFDLKEDLLQPSPPPPAKLLFRPTPFDQVGVISFGLPEWILQDPPAKKKKYGAPFTRPTDYEKLKTLVAAWVRQQGEHFPDHFEIFNEPEWQWKGTNEDLVLTLAAIADGIKTARPQTKVLGPGFSTIRIKDPARLDLETANKLGLFDHLDGIVIHAYVDGTAPEGEFIQRVTDLQNWLRDTGRPDYPIHLTEFGWTTGKGTWQKPVDEITQARYLTRALTLLAAQGIQNATYFCLQFKAAPNPGERGFSIVHDDTTPKPSYAAYANLARWIANIRGLGTHLHLTPTTHLILFERNNAPSIAIAWDTEAERIIEIPLQTTRRSTMTGRPLAPSATHLALSPSPTFLEFPSHQPPAIRMNAPLSVMRGGEPVTLPQAADWIAPAPLTIHDRITLTIPPTTPNGDYLLLAPATENNGWLGQPIHVIPPLAVTPPTLKWPADAPSPHLTTTLTSHTTTPLTTRLAVALNDTRDQFLDPAPMQPGETRPINIPLPNLTPGKRHRGQLTIDSRHAGRRDQITRQLDITLLASHRLPSPAAHPDWDWNKIAPIDFSTWDPFGGPIAPEDCSATLQSAWSPAGLHLRIVVRDDEHLNTHATTNPEQLWTQDSIQIGLDPDYEKTWEANDLFGLKGHRVFEYGVGWSGNPADTPANWRWISHLPDLPVGTSEQRIQQSITRNGDLTTYEIHFPWPTLGLDKPPPPGAAIGIALSVMDADTGLKAKGRRALRLYGGIDGGKDPEKFGPLWLR
ncbi:sugar-binding protein [Geminisphaera colitermitum]|uniref:sugar-binding protein n=1 Tax=Geminisphaera colitermitum TaxID=1148786 RepID=UPI0005BE49BE|nr:sugar-binding protein [Geminisphaera colitermitum]